MLAVTVRLMSDGELTRLEVLRDLDRQGLTTDAAAQLLGLGRRQVFRLLKAYRVVGAAGLLSKRRAIGIDAAHGHRMHQARLAQLAREAGRTTAQHIAGYERQRRHATLVAIILELGAALTDQAIDLFERLVGSSTDWRAR